MPLAGSRKADQFQPRRGSAGPFLVPRPAGSRFGLRFQPAVPVLPATLLQLDLLLSQPVFDLHEISNVVLSDLGATVQVLRSAAPHETTLTRPVAYLEDCIVHLGGVGLRHAMSSPTPSQAAPPGAEIRDLWKRARIIGELARTVASGLPDMSPSDAQLAGVLHEMGRLPALLGWRIAGMDLSDPLSVGTALVREWRLPQFLAATLLAPCCKPRTCTPLNQVISAAWELAGGITRQEQNCIVRRFSAGLP